ncbi:hypothetical protein OOK27_16075 [Streptomyces canus]|uniref:hypothetical protein n=1 Tax=Streptomyces canus TaxID=58343 RepID=UPI00225706EF|nr:hypothetical protein [Streptomyces canus]MCX5255637.1 hypothetical protein [Streptomyces canus]
MTQAQTETVPEQIRPGRTRWGMFTAILAVPTLVVAGLIALLVAWLFTDDSVDTGVRTASCAEALAFGGAKLPTGAYDARCTIQAGQDTRYEAGFRMPRDEVREWLTATYPDGPRLRTEQCGSYSVDECLNRGPVAGQSSSVQVEVTYDGPNWSEVRFVAFTL